MSVTRLDLKLDKFEIGLSGAVPNRDEWTEPAMDRGILEFVSLFSALIIKYGGRIVHGCHPSFTPIILRQARLHSKGRSRKPVTLIMSQLWADSLTDDDKAEMTDVAEFIITARIGDGGPEDPKAIQASLTAMRRVLVGLQNVMVVVGGKPHTDGDRIPGVLEEMTIAASNGIPRFLVGGLGGFASTMRESTASLNNYLTDDANSCLFFTKDVGACVGTIFEHLSSSERIANAVLPPIRWDTDAKALVTSSGLRDEATDLVVSAVV